MAENQSLKEYYKYDVFAFLNGFGGPSWGGLTYFMGIPVAFLTFLHASKAQIGLITAIFWAGFALPQVWSAYASEILTIKKKFMAKVVFLAAIAWLVLGLFVLITKASNEGLTIWLFLILFAWSCTLVGMFMPPNFNLLFKIIPTERLGQLLGILFAIQFLGVVAAGPVMAKIYNVFGEPMNYAVLFLLTFVVSIIAITVLLSIKEPEGEQVEGTPSLGAYLGKCFEIVKVDKTLVKFIVGKWLMSGHYIMLAFLLVYLMGERGFSPANAGYFTAFHALGLFIGGFTITRIADKYGPKQMLLTSHLIAIVYVVVAWLVPSNSIYLFFAAFVITGLAQISDNVGYTNMCLFCCPTAEKSAYIAVTNIGVNILTVPLPIIIGVLMDKGILSFGSTFGIVLGMMVLAILYILAIMENPKAFIDMKAAA